jgi:tetratricopeptide (TPR) repeat protein
MTHPSRASLPAILLALSLAVGSPAGVGVAFAQEAEAQADKEAKKEAKRREREARIEEYLRKKEERRAQRELERQQKEAREAQEAVDLAVFSDETEPVPEAEEIPTPGGKPEEEEEVVLPRELARVQEIVRNGPMGQDPTVEAYLDLIDRAEASPQQLAAFGNFLSDSGWPRGAIVYYAVALGIEQEDPILWLNAGTIHRQLGEHGPAAQAFERVLSIDPNNAFAHYNLGAVLDDAGKYESALEEYKIALTLDPSLGDPATNPAAANNERLLAVRLLLYQEQAGNVGLPLVDVPGGGLDDEAQAEEAPDR